MIITADPRRLVALTIDTEHPDRRGWSPGCLERMLDHLDRARIPATFFLQGRWVTAHPHLATEVRRRGHLVGNHSQFHTPMPLLSRAGQVADIRAAHLAILSVVGVDPRPWFRSPFGAGLKEPKLGRTLAQLGYRNVGWDVDGRDWEEDRSPDDVAEALITGTLAGEGPRILLLHSWSAAAAAALPAVIDRLVDRDVEFVTLSNYSTVAPPAERAPQ
ncbi:MAG: polysaccharide deacetylase family protein [Candidatus Dormiibacterota bacterium]